jgi:phosphatidate cytidylyltransferase
VSSPEPPRAKFDPWARRSWTDLGPRLASAVVLIAVTAICLYLGSYVFAALVGAVFAGCYREWDRMVTLKPLTAVGTLLIGMVALSALVFPLLGAQGTAAIIVLACLVAALLGRDGAVWRVGGLIFVGLVIIALLATRGTQPDGFFAGLLLGIVVWLTDTGAFFTGRQVGGERLAPDISPSKTWSGALGGLALGTVGGLVFWLLATDSPWWIGGLLAASISILGQLGDLAESAIKRRFRIKDSGDIIPGHGGLMDRLDSLTFAALLVFVVGFAHGGYGRIAAGVLNW